ncbi:dCTP deaminase [Coleofasciculus sp. E2-BRE-01]|uniref:dCTP deaminase n=1 Tax=Coleofasciculus sp. E2-BRE-01 TaxID=3069524 RepID=UPI004064BC8E
MSILTDTDLKKILCFDEEQWNKKEKTLLIQNGSDDCITPMGYDLRVGGFCKRFIAKPNLVTLNEKGKIEIKPGDIALIGTLEKIKMPQDGSISALILSRVSQVSRGLSNISTKVDPGWAEGELIIPVQNFSRDTVKLSYGDKLCTIVFFENTSNSSSLYDSGASREKFFKLLAQTRKQSLNREIILGITSVTIVGIAFAVGWLVFKNSLGFAVTVTVGIALEKVASGIAARLLGIR